MKKGKFQLVLIISLLVFLSRNQDKVLGQVLHAIEDSIELTNLTAVTPEGEYFLAPQWSPDGKRLLITSEGYEGLYIVNANRSGSIQAINEGIGVGYGARWSDDGKKIFYRRKQTDEDNLKMSYGVFSINLFDNEIENHPDIEPSTVSSSQFVKLKADTMVYINLETLKIEAKTTKGFQKWVITKDEGQYYNPILSPDKTKVLVHRGSEMLIYAIDGSGLLNSLGRGLGSSWSPDSQHILYFIDYGDGHQITMSEIFLCTADGLSNVQLTNTRDIIETWPSWSPDGQMLAFSDYKSGRIYVGRIDNKN